MDLAGLGVGVLSRAPFPASLADRPGDMGREQGDSEEE
jgi:hypothetical protein